MFGELTDSLFKGPGVEDSMPVRRMGDSASVQTGKIIKDLYEKIEYLEKRAEELEKRIEKLTND